MNAPYNMALLKAQCTYNAFSFEECAYRTQTENDFCKYHNTNGECLSACAMVNCAYLLLKKIKKGE